MRFSILFMRVLAPLPLPVFRALGWALGQLLDVFAVSRRRIVLTNLRLCFPQWPERRRRALARRNVVRFAQAFVDRVWLWHASAEVARRRLRLTGAIDDLTRPGAVVIFAPHFYGMDAGGSAIMTRVQRAASILYATQHNAALDAWMLAGRARFGDVTPIARSAGPKPVLRSLREGRMLYLLPDMDLGRRDSVFVPFFGVNAATVPSLSRFARLGHARVVPVVTRMTRQGYEARVHPAWADFPSADPVADAARMNRELQGYVLEMPEQYYWVHKRFKTRPPGEPSLYARPR
jgi:KDO2-lipid IV(A) lauroyltransferase